MFGHTYISWSDKIVTYISVKPIGGYLNENIVKKIKGGSTVIMKVVWLRKYYKVAF